MENAHTVLREIASYPTYRDVTQWAIFLHTISMATNEGATLNPVQRNYLWSLVSAHTTAMERNVLSDGLIEAASIATWINSCR